jgi:hypothetical protein
MWGGGWGGHGEGDTEEGVADDDWLGSLRAETAARTAAQTAPRRKKGHVPRVADVAGGPGQQRKGSVDGKGSCDCMEPVENDGTWSPPPTPPPRQRPGRGGKKGPAPRQAGLTQARDQARDNFPSASPLAPGGRRERERERDNGGLEKTETAPSWHAERGGTRQGERESERERERERGSHGRKGAAVPGRTFDEPVGKDISVETIAMLEEVRGGCV